MKTLHLLPHKEKNFYPSKPQQASQEIGVQAKFKSTLTNKEVKVQILRYRPKSPSVLCEPNNLYTDQLTNSERFYGRNKSIDLMFTGVVFRINDLGFQSLEKEEKLNVDDEGILFKKQFVVQQNSFLQKYYSSYTHNDFSESAVKGYRIKAEGSPFIHCYGGNYIPGGTLVKDIKQTYFNVWWDGMMTERGKTSCHLTSTIYEECISQQCTPLKSEKLIYEDKRGYRYCFIDLLPSSPPTSLEEDICSGKLKISLDRPHETCFYKSKSYLQNDVGSELVTIIYEKIGSLPKVSSPQEKLLSLSKEQTKEVSSLLEESIEGEKPQTPSELKISKNKKYRYRSPERNQNTSYTKLRNGLISELSQWEKARDNLSHGEVTLSNVMRTIGYGSVYALDLMSTGLDKTLNILTRGDYGVYQEVKHETAQFARTVLRRAVRLTTSNPTVAQEVGDYAYLMLSFGGGKKLGNYLKIKKLSQTVSKQNANSIKRAENIKILTKETRPLRALDLASDEKISRPSKVNHRKASEKIKNGPAFPTLKIHANKHGGLHPNEYYNRAVNHIKTGTKIKFRHDGQNKVAYVTRINVNLENDEKLYKLTSTIRDGRKILTHVEEGVTDQYLKNIGITLPKDF